MPKATWNGAVLAESDNGEGDQQSRAAAWYYAVPQEAANNIKEYVAFWHGVTVEV